MFQANKRIGFYSVVMITACMIIAGCTVGPDYSRPQTPADTAESFVNVPAGSVDVNVIESAGPWWQSFGDPVINDLVARALRNNYDLKAAAARLLEAEAFLKQSHGLRLPDISYSASRSRTKSSIVWPVGGRQSFFSTTYSQEISISYMVDFFGRLKRSEQAALADMLAEQAAHQTLIHAIIAQTVRSRVQIATAQQLLDVARATTKSWRDSLEVVERRYNYGLASPLDVYLARENFSAAQAREPQLQQSVLLAHHSLDVLTGQRPASSEPLEQTLSELPPLEPVPVAVPAALLDRRPDIRAAEFRLVAATERIGVSIAGLFPDLTLSASGGFTSDTFSKITANEGQVYSAVMALATPIFKGGRLRAQVDAAKARTEQQAANYAQTILIGLREVEDALVRQQMLTERVEKLKQRLADALRAESLAMERYQRGVERLLIVLETQRRRAVAQNELIVTRGELFNARVDLFLGLGGDWQTPAVTKSTEHKESQTWRN